jgi:hypothetical protein
MLTITQALAQPALQPAMVIAVKTMERVVAVSCCVHGWSTRVIDSNYHYTLRSNWQNDID